MEAFAQLIPNRGDVDNLRFGGFYASIFAVHFTKFELILDKYHRHRFTDVVAGDRGHAIGALGIHRDGDVRGSALLIDSRRRADDLITGDDYATLEQHRVAVTLGIKSGTYRCPAGSLRRTPVSETAMNQPKLEGRGSAENFLCANRILHPG